jgi:hypothetical protein
VGEHQEDFHGQDCGEEQQEEEEEDSEEQLSRAAAAVTGRQRNSSVSSSDVVSYFSCYLCKYLNFSVPNTIRWLEISLLPLMVPDHQRYANIFLFWIRAHHVVVCLVQVNNILLYIFNSLSVIVASYIF